MRTLPFIFNSLFTDSGTSSLDLGYILPAHPWYIESASESSLFLLRNINQSTAGESIVAVYNDKRREKIEVSTFIPQTTEFMLQPII